METVISTLIKVVIVIFITLRIRKNFYFIVFLFIPFFMVGVETEYSWKYLFFEASKSEMQHAIHTGLFYLAIFSAVVVLCGQVITSHIAKENKNQSSAATKRE